MRTLVHAPGHRAHGFALPGFDGVVRAFERNFQQHQDTGAAFVAVRDGEAIVDLWGGFAQAEQGRRWGADTLVVIFSGTKGLVALCLLMLVDRGLLDPDAPVSEYWPEFGQAGKSAVRVSDIASHQARLPGVAARVTEEAVLDSAQMAALLAAQTQDCDPRASAAYHALTFGWLCDELVRRIDGRSAGQFFADEVAAPLDLELWIGLPQDLEHRVATLYAAGNWGKSLFDETRLAADELLARVYMNPQLLKKPDPWNTRAFHAAEIPGAGGIGSARSIARLYSCLAAGGEISGVRLLSRATLRRGLKCLARRREALTDEPMAFGFGFALQTELQPMGPPEMAFGHPGAGGSAHAAWPEQRVGFSYCMNLMRDDHDVDPRSQALLRALYDAL